MGRQDQGTGSVQDPVLVHPGEQVQSVRVHNQPAGIMLQQVFQRFPRAFSRADAHAESDGFDIGNKLRDFFLRKDHFISVVAQGVHGAFQHCGGDHREQDVRNSQLYHARAGTHGGIGHAGQPDGAAVAL